MENINPNILKSNILNWLESLRVKNAPYGTFKMSESTEATLFSSCFAVFLKELYDDLKNITQQQRQEWISLISNAQDEEAGLFTEKRLKEQELFSTKLCKTHDPGYVTWQLTTFCISALKSLEGKIKYPLKFLDEWKSPDKVTAWLETLDWKNGTWCAGNLAMFLGICSIIDYERNKDEKTKKAIDAFFDWHDKHQDPKTGFWGTDKGAPIQIGLFGAMHQYLLYYYTDRPLQYIDKIIDYSIMFQEKDGHFYPGSGGGGCEDYDVVDTLVNLYKRTDYRKDDIKRVLKKSLEATVDTIGEDGGFLWAKRRKFTPKDWMQQFFSFTKHWNFSYWKWSCRKAVGIQWVLIKREGRLSTGWTDTPIPINESDIFATWFRSLNIAEINGIIETPYSNINWKYLKTPGLGWHKETILGD